jgi:beta-lactam-binding protein with PASTA domain
MDPQSTPINWRFNHRRAFSGHAEVWLSFLFLLMSFVLAAQTRAQPVPTEPLPEAYVGSTDNEVLLSLAFEDAIEESLELGLLLAESSGVAGNVRIAERKDLSSATKRIFAIAFDIAADVAPGTVETLVFAPASDQLFSYDQAALQFSFRAVEFQEPASPVRRETCNSEVRQGGNTPETIILDTGDYQGNARFSWEMFTVKDRMRVYLGNRLLQDTGCADHAGETLIPVQADGQELRVEVLPNCEKPDETRWNFRFDCSNPDANSDRTLDQSDILRLVKIEGPTAKETPSAIVRYSPGEPGCFEHTISRSEPNRPSGHEYLGSIQMVNPPLELHLGEPFQLFVEARYGYKRRIMDCPVGYQSFGPPAIRFMGMPSLKGEEIRQPCPKQSDQTRLLVARQNLQNLLKFTFEKVTEGNGQRSYRYRAETASKKGDRIQGYFDISSQGVVFSVGLEPQRGATMIDGIISFHYAPVAAGSSQTLTSVPRYQHPEMELASSAGGPGEGHGGAEAIPTNDPAARLGIRPGPSPKPVTALAPGPGSAIALNPDSPDVSRLIKAWLGNAEPLANAQGADLSFDQWGRVQGRAAAGVITLQGSPDDVAGRTPEQYVWGQRDSLDSLNLCTLREFVELSLSGSSTEFCREGHNTQMQVGTELPALAGKTYQEAVAAIEAAGLVALPPELGSNTSDPALVGRVELTVPEGDGLLKRGDKVGLRLFGKAVVGVPVPNVVGRAVRDAAREIETAGLVADFELGAETTDLQKAQTVASQTPMPGVEIEAGKTVKMLVLTLKEKTITVPELRNSAVSKVDQLLRQAGLKMDAQLGDLAPNSRQQSGQVYRQSPPPGLEVKAGAVVEVWVYGEYQDAVPSVKETAPPAETATEYCALGKANFPYQPDREYFVFRGREPRKITSRNYSREYNFLADNARNAQAAVRQIQQEGKMELVFTGKLPDLCPHLRENCAYSTLNHADGSFFGDICGKWADPVRASVAQRPAPMPDLTVVKVPNFSGMQLAEAQRVLQQSGLQMFATLAGAAPNRSAVGRVAKQKPQSGQEIAAGTVVELWVYGEILAGEPVPPTPVADRLSGVPFITIPNLPAGKAIYEQACGSTRTGLQYTPGQRYLRPNDQFKKNDQTRGFCAANPSGFGISATWLEASDGRNSKTGQSYLQENTCSVGKAQPQLKHSKMTYDSSSGLPIIELAAIVVHSSKSRAFVAVQDMADAYLDKHRAELVRIAETMLAEIEPYAMSCAEKTDP